MKKLFLLLVLMVFSLTACTQGYYESQGDLPKDDATESLTTSPQTYREPQGNLPIDDVTENYMYIDGKEIYLPCFFRDFTSYGWSLTDDSDIEPNWALNCGNSQPDGNVLEFKNQKYETIGSITLRNESDVTLEVESCVVSDVVLNAEKGTFVLPGNITETSTKEEIIEVFGTDVDNPYYETVEMGEDSICYGYPYNNKMLRYDFYFDGNVLKWVKVLNVTDTDNFA